MNSQVLEKMNDGAAFFIHSIQIIGIVVVKCFAKTIKSGAHGFRVALHTLKKQYCNQNNIKMKNTIQLCLIAGVLLTSCSTVAHLQTDDLNQTFAATDPGKVEIYSTDKVDKQYAIIGEVVASADAGADASIPVKYLKKEAAKLGADAIINLKLEIEYGYWNNGIKASGLAVKFN